MEVSDLTAGVLVFAGHTVGFQPEYSPANVRLFNEYHALLSAMGKKPAANNLPVTIVFWLISAVLAGEPRKLMKRKLFCHPAYVLEC